MQKINTCYDATFYSKQSVGSYRSAQQLVPFIMKYLKPQSVIDIGCGIGTWLKVFHDLGSNVKGIDGDYVDRRRLMIDVRDFNSMNLEKSILLKEKFDLVMSLEVAEHLPEKRAESFVEDLTRLGDVILFSAAIPLQGGTNHINERKLSYWRDLFEKFQFCLVDCIRPLIWNNKEINPCYRQNVVLFVNQNMKEEIKGLKILKTMEKDRIIDIVHPDIYEENIKAMMMISIIKRILKRGCPAFLWNFLKEKKNNIPKKF